MATVFGFCWGERAGDGMSFAPGGGSGQLYACARCWMQGRRGDNVLMQWCNNAQTCSVAWYSASSPLRSVVTLKLRWNRW